MTPHDFIFSTKPAHRLSRHLVFWVVYAFYFTLQSYGCPTTGFMNRQAVKHAWESTGCYLPFCILSVYSFLYILFPLFLEKRKYAAFVLAFTVLFALGVWLNYFQSVLFYKLAGVSNLNFRKIAVQGYGNVCQAILISGFALGMKLAKTWYRQQKENLALAKQKTAKELQLLKARIHPDFLFRSLDSLYDKINSGSPAATTMILKLSDLLSYILYECDAPLVPLEKELTITEDFISIAKLNFGDRLKITSEINGDTKNKFIAPLILLSFLQNSFPPRDRDQKGYQKMNVDISIENNELIFILRSTTGSSRTTQDALYQDVYEYA